MLVNDFKMAPKEVAYLSEHSADFAGFDLNALPLDTDGFRDCAFQSVGTAL